MNSEFTYVLIIQAVSIKSCSKSMEQLVMRFECVSKNDTKLPSGVTGRRVWFPRSLFDLVRSI